MPEHEAAGEPWNPWSALRARPGATLVWQRLVATGGLVEQWSDGTEVIVLDPRLGRRDRRAVLAHELVHLERRLLPEGSPPGVIAREEHQVRAETVRRLVPSSRLAAFVAARGEVEAVTASVVADEFDVPVAIAVAALDRLRRA